MVSGVVIFLLMIITAFLGIYYLGANVFMGCYSNHKLSFNYTVVGNDMYYGYGEDLVLQTQH